MTVTRFLPVLAMLTFSACAMAPDVWTVSPGEPTEPSVGFDENDMRLCVSDIAMKLQSVAANRCRVEPKRRLPVEIRPFACEGVSADQVSIGKLLASHLEEELTDGGMFVVVCPVGSDQSEKASAVAAQYRIVGEFIQRKVPLDKGGFMIDYSIKVRLVQISSGLDFFARNLTLRKYVAK